MTDIGDRAQKLEQLHRDRALLRRVPRPQKPAEHCIDCSVKISEERRAVEPEANRCTDCKAIRERNYGIG